MNKAQTNKKRVCIVVYDISDMGGTNQVASSLAAELVKKYDLYVLSIRKNREDIPHAFPDGVPITVLLDESADCLLELTGERITESVVNEVFSRFCVGK